MNVGSMMDVSFETKIIQNEEVRYQLLQEMKAYGQSLSLVYCKNGKNDNLFRNELL